MPSASEILKKHESRIQRAVDQTPRVQRKGPTRPWQIESKDEEKVHDNKAAGDGSRKAAAEKLAAEKAAAEKLAAEKAAAEKLAAEKAAAEKLAAEKAAAEKLAAEKAAAEKLAAEKAAAEKLAVEKAAAERLAAEKAAAEKLVAEKATAKAAAAAKVGAVQLLAGEIGPPTSANMSAHLLATGAKILGDGAAASQVAGAFAHVRVKETGAAPNAASSTAISASHTNKLPEAAATLLGRAHLLGFDLAMKFEILSKMADADGILRFSQPELAALFKVSILTVKRLLTDLCERGKLKLIREHDPKLKNPTEYQIL